MSWMAGVDGCRGGWVAVQRCLSSGALESHVAEDLAAVLAWTERAAVVGIDMPIGLLDRAAVGGRLCDRLARGVVGGRRACTVFSPPARIALAGESPGDAVARNRASSPHGVGISRQCHGLFARIEELDEWITPERQERVVEVHPEVTFAVLAGRGIEEPKKAAAGAAARVALLADAWRVARDWLAVWVGDAVRDGAARDDVVDALAACASAERLVRGTAKRLPEEPTRDARGLRMQIVA